MYNEEEKACSKLFWQLLNTAVLVCLIVMIICLIWFCCTTGKFSAECNETLLAIKSSVASVDASCMTMIPNPTYTPAVAISMTPSSTFTSVPSTTPLSVPSSASSSATIPTTSSDIASEKEDRIKSLITHMENLVAIQRTGMTNDLMSFVYGILSSILVGLCVTFVVKSRTNADEVRKIAAEAKENAKDAERQAKNVGEKVNDIASVIDQAKTATEKAKKNAEAALQQAGIAEDSVKATKKAIEQANNATEIVKVFQYQLRLLIVSDRIMSAKTALSRFNKALANREIIKISDEIYSLFSCDDEYKRIIESCDLDSTEIGKVYNELVVLKENVNEFLVECNKTFEDFELESMEIAASNYIRWIQSSIDCMDSFINETRNLTE